MSAGSVVTTTEVAVQAFERLRSGATSERLHAWLGAWEDWTSARSVEPGEHPRWIPWASSRPGLCEADSVTLESLAAGLGKRRHSREAHIELPLVQLPKHSPNRCWKCKHPNKVVLLEEAKACVCFLGTHVDVFAQEPWLWLHDVMDSIVLALELWRSKGLAAPRDVFSIQAKKTLGETLRSKMYVLKLTFLQHTHMWTYVSLFRIIRLR